MKPDLERIERELYIGHYTEQCPYLPEKEASLCFLNGIPLSTKYRELMDEGYRRNGYYVYKPVCETCRECKVLRVPVNTFKPSKSQRRVWNKCKSRFHHNFDAPHYTESKGDVYQRYLDYQHEKNKEDVAESYRQFLCATWLGPNTQEHQIYDGGRLVGVGIVDLFDDAISTVYFFFDPDYARFSLGTYSALAEIELAKEWGMDYYYLGYYIAECRAMNYKVNFRPCQIRTPGDDEWVWLK